jgi:hypothetical protein
MTLGAPTALTSDDGRDIIDPGTNITDSLLARLLETGVGHVWIEDPCGQDCKIVHNPFVSSALESAARLLRRAHVVARRSELPFQVMKDLVDGVDNLERRMFRESGPLQLTDRLLGDGTDEVDHAANVCYLSLGIALRMTGYIREARRNAPKSASDSLLTLSLAAIMHDIGKIVGDNPSAVNNVLTADEDDVNYHAHVAVGANLLTDYRDKAVGKIVLNHHQRFDGTGFPALFHREPGGTRREPVSGTHIHIFARIVGLADAFERLRSQKSGPHAIAYAYANVLGEYRSWFDPQLLDALPEIIRPYFPGEMLALKDGSVGAVDSTHAGNPLAADLKIVFDPAGKMIPPAERRGLQIDAVKLLNLPEPFAPVTSST